MMKIAVIILNWNGEEMMKDFLPSVVKYSNGEDVEVVVADNGSTDGSVKMIKENFPSVRLVLLDKNYGFADGYNYAIEQVEAEYVVLLNSDVEVTENWLQPLVAYMDEHKEVAAAQPKIRWWRKKELFEYAGAAGGYIDKYGYPFCRGRLFNTLEEDRGQYDSVKDIFWASGAALFIRRDVYIKVGGLDGGFFAHMEEIDLCWRINSRGYRLVCLPESVVYHLGGATLSKENPRKTYLNFRNNLLMLYKNLNDKEVNGILRTRFFLDGLAAFVFLLKGELGNAKAVVRAWNDFRRMKKDYKKKRLENMTLTTNADIKTIYPSLSLIDYYIKRRKALLP